MKDDGLFPQNGDGLVLTASTKDLRKFVRKHARDPKAFPEDDNFLLHRQPE